MPGMPWRLARDCPNGRGVERNARGLNNCDRRIVTHEKDRSPQTGCRIHVNHPCVPEPIDGRRNANRNQLLKTRHLLWSERDVAEWGKAEPRRRTEQLTNLCPKGTRLSVVRSRPLELAIVPASNRADTHFQLDR